MNEMARARAEESLRKSEERFRLAAQAGKMYAYEWDVASDVVIRSGDISGVLGVTGEASLTQQQLLAKVHPDDRALFTASVAERTPEYPDVQISYRLLCPDGSVVWLEKTAHAFFDEGGRMVRMIGMVANITERKLAEEALRESEQRFRLAAQAGKMYSFEWDVTTDAVVRSSEHITVLGVTEPLRITHQQFVDKVHPEDRPRLMAAIAGLRPEKPTCDITYRVQARNEALVWIKSNGRAFFDGEGKLLKLIGMVADVTDLKRAEEALSGMTRKLVEAQEQERARIARELHDDIIQRLAVLAIELRRSRDTLKDAPEVRDHLYELQLLTEVISTDVYALAHELHSSTLECLGLVTGMRSWCKEFGERQKLKIEFKSHDVPRLPQDISLCLFRVLQEALHNAAKHGGVKRVEVRLAENSGEIHLIVSDSGRGFDIEAARRSRGLGLTSMQERVRLVGGTIAIDSKPLAGTTIHVCVPFTAQLPALG